ncbi:hypothetical protein A2643_02285 [Candidatus Nomurabacteria bacterium RIFCSPHIGHO2_01_FULL_39_220]|uniref:DUF1573 domain-containing protein n=1 Tax=Candidatus Nomurabacteria bacterium RIFCSPLOWO2_02_FULL_40_67 TaxID=1801787 RepID=A0A1F6Y2U8_9BACT|nr:MAG: hypothetical protein UU01_C0020G0016 [Parcubacteria group bacterium GW2011_GWA2_40_37]KKS13819.1 MAG: hypothetical protein UU71_C0042G0004 [Parcubacteria group bacterium GW2011_GWB1_41_6]OGI70987.1 MAG: hypothetical protein A2643_02285 [Candidatus Nomurabacteria bacterium RIFCSPHIGHO2_01_FULL_39_220]OGI72712.1 MAG: hypothetical protein A2W56_02675 [Candidatus Nomurabacteria bacterium RIFCSPHIGHO2_02_41_18]OGI78076.1 MAG: hypothetical protein A3C65_03355 [Candidatus Nomurabacteria bacter
MKDKNKIITFITVIVLLFIGLFFFGKPDQNGSNAIKTNNIPEGAEELANSHTAGLSGALIAPETFYDFGKISMKDGNVSKVFKVANSGNQDINLKNLSTSCMCTNAYILDTDGKKRGPFGMPGHGGGITRANEIIKAGESRNIEVVYDPNAHGPAGVGMIDRFVYLEDASGNKLQFEIKANVTP